MPMPKKTEKYKHITISVSLPPELLKKLKKQKHPRETMSNCVRNLIEIGLKEIKDGYSRDDQAET